MQYSRRSNRSTLLLALIALLVMNCRVWSPAERVQQPPVVLPAATVAVQPTAQPTLAVRLPEPVLPQPGEAPQPAPAFDVPAGEPAGCLSADAQAALASPMDMLAYADSLLDLKVPLSERINASVWNAATGINDFTQRGAFSLRVDDVQNEYWIQSMMNALHVAGFITWLRGDPEDSLHILAIPLTPEVLQPDFAWAGYVAPYWQDRFALPSHDGAVVRALKLPPCAWMVEQGYAPLVHSGWWSAGGGGWPDYAWAAGAYLAADDRAAHQIAQQIDWLGPQLEAPNTMCGPLSWAILNDAGAFPPGVGGWAWGGKSFWLAKPPANGRPWSLFPPGTFSIHHFDQALSRFDFNAFPLYPGDFLYLYSKKDGFDHMLVVTEIDEQGNVYTVTNLVDVYPEEKTTVERVVLYNIYDASVGVARNRWANDGRNGRTGHDGFDVFRWAWMEKDISGQPAAYTVQVGDTLGLIAERWKTPANAIAEYNGISIDAPLAVGQVILIPPNVGALPKAAAGR